MADAATLIEQSSNGRKNTLEYMEERRYPGEVNPSLKHGKFLP